MSNKSNQRIIGLERETTQGLCPMPILDKVRRDDDGRRVAPLKMRFEWEGRIYEGTAHYVGNTREQDKRQ
jgi:hypothetical protein